MRNPLFDVVQEKYKRPNTLTFGIGEDVVVTIRIVEGNKERLQDFEGTVIARKGSGLDEMFTVRRLIGQQGVERTFPLHSPKIVQIKTKRTGKVRRCKLYYLRDRVGKARKLREKRRPGAGTSRKAAARANAAKLKAQAEAEAVTAEVTA